MMFKFYTYRWDSVYLISMENSIPMQENVIAPDVEAGIFH